MSPLKKVLLGSRFGVLLVTLATYLLLLVIEGTVTGRDARVVDFANPFFDLRITSPGEFSDIRSPVGGIQ